MKSSLSEMQRIVNEIEIFDTHEHCAGFDWGFGGLASPVGQVHPRKSLPHVLMNDMLLYITGAARVYDPKLAPQEWPIEDAAAYWKLMQKALAELRATAVYTTIRRGIQELYGFEGDEITDGNWEAINRKIVRTYDSKGAPLWLLEVLKRARIKAIVQMIHLPYMLEYWPSLPAARRRQEMKIVHPSLRLDPLFFSGFEPDSTKARERTMKLLKRHPRNHAEYLEFLHAAVERHRREGGVALKIICAYQRSLFFGQVPDSEAKRLYAKGPENLKAEEMRRLQDNLVWHLVRFAREFELPIQIHTGYAVPTELGDPENLYNLARHPDFQNVQFCFCHAGWPNYGGLALMARTYPNVHFGFCWLVGLSPSLAARLMDEMFDILPANKMMMGMDCGSIESLYGTALMTRELVAKVLAAKVDSGLISRRAAVTLANRLLHDNGQALFGRVAARLERMGEKIRT
jgi:predicted TIM-barrel fold metal-dependent hydrolase